MSKHPTEPDANQTAHAVVSEFIAKHETPLPADVEAAWAEWSRGVQKVDARGMTLLRAAFEAGAGVGRRVAENLNSSGA